MSVFCFCPPYGACRFAKAYWLNMLKYIVRLILVAVNAWRMNFSIEICHDLGKICMLSVLPVTVTCLIYRMGLFAARPIRPRRRLQTGSRGAKLRLSVPPCVLSIPARLNSNSFCQNTLKTCLVYVRLHKKSII